MNVFSRLAIVLIGTATTAFGLMLLYRHYIEIHRLRELTNRAKKQEVPSAESSSPSFSTCSGNNDNHEASISSEELHHLVSMLPAANTAKFFKIMKTFIQFSNDNANIPSFRSHTLLESLFCQLTLGGDGDFLRSVNVHVLNLFTNIMVDEVIRDYLKEKMGKFFDASLSTLNENEQVALFRLLGNFAMLSDSADAVAKHFTEVFAFVTCESTSVRRQAWTVLLNLSCEPNSVITMLKSSVPDDTKEILKKSFQEKDEVILSKSLKFLANIYESFKSFDGDISSQESLFRCLHEVIMDLKSYTTLLLIKVTSKEEICDDAQRLLKTLQEFH